MNLASRTPGASGCGRIGLIIRAKCFVKIITKAYFARALMKFIFWFITVGVLHALSLGIFGQVRLWGTPPDVLMLLVVFLALEVHEPESIDPSVLFFAALIAGLFRDFSSGLYFGSLSFAYLILAVLVREFFAKLTLYQSEFKYLLVVVAAAVVFLQGWQIIYSLAFWKLHFSQGYFSWRILRATLLPALIYNLLLAYPMYWLIKKLKSLSFRLQKPKVL